MKYSHVTTSTSLLVLASSLLLLFGVGSLSVPSAGAGDALRPLLPPAALSHSDEQPSLPGSFKGALFARHEGHDAKEEMHDAHRAVTSSWGHENDYTLDKASQPGDANEDSAEGSVIDVDAAKPDDDLHKVAPSAGAHDHAHDHDHTESGPPSVAAPQSNSHTSTGGDHHHHSGPALEHLNETLILQTHAPDPTSYFDLEQTDAGRGAWLVTHITLACLAFFVLLPLTIFVKGGGSALSIVPQTAFLSTSVLSLCFGAIYNAATPNMYEGSSHSKLGWVVMMAVIALNVVDVARFLLRSTRWGAKSTPARAVESFHHEEHSPLFTEEERVSSPAEPIDMAAQDWSEVPLHASYHQFSSKDSRRSDSMQSDETLYDSAGGDAVQAPTSYARSPTFGRYITNLLCISESLLVVFGYVEFLSGIAVFTGSCRENYINGCLAHMIKGSIFFFYGLLTWARYVGAFARFGWAWNRHPHSRIDEWTAEFVESLVCFIYGSTNVWLERLGKGDSPWSVKDVQHASIALMFWFAGLLGMLLESRKVRSMLSTTAVIASGRSELRITPPASASFSFNPFPAIIIGTTGIAMSAHAQTYVFQVSIHALWGLLLALFSLSRFLTYFFLYLRPPASILPSRPPTEALASMFLTCGGVVFILSTEQVTFAAMRHGWDDMMAFLNVTVSFVSILFCWILVLFALQGALLKRRSSSGVKAQVGKVLSEPSHESEEEVVEEEEVKA